MNSAWKKLWSECVPYRDLDCFEVDSGSARHSQFFLLNDSTIIHDIATMEQGIGLEVEADDIEELLEDYGIKLTTEVLEHIQNEREKIG